MEAAERLVGRKGGVAAVGKRVQGRMGGKRAIRLNINVDK